MHTRTTHRASALRKYGSLQFVDTSWTSSGEFCGAFGVGSVRALMPLGETTPTPRTWLPVATRHTPVTVSPRARPRPRESAFGPLLQVKSV